MGPNLGEEIEDYVNNISNSFYTDPKTTQFKNGEQSFRGKKFPLLMESEIRINSNLDTFLDNGNWNKNSIEERANKLAELVNSATSSL